MLRRSSHGRYVLEHHETVSLTELEKRSWNNINELMVKEETARDTNFKKISPIINKVFTELANHDVRFEFDPVELDSTYCTKISRKTYIHLCFLKQIPQGKLVLEGNVDEGALKARLSRIYEQSYDDVCWDDILLPPDETGCRYFSTTKLQDVLRRSLKHVIDEVKSTLTEGNVEIKVSVKNHLLVLSVKIRGEASLRLTMIPAIKMNEEVAEKCSNINSRLSKLFKQLETKCSGGVHVVAQPMYEFTELLWRINTHDIENRLVQKLQAGNDCFSRCLFALNIMNEIYYEEKRVSMLLPMKYIRWALISECLKNTHERHWREKRFHERLKSALQHLKACLTKGVVENLVTGTNMAWGREPATLAEFARITDLYLTEIKGFLLGADIRNRSDSKSRKLTM